MLRCPQSQFTSSHRHRRTWGNTPSPLSPSFLSPLPVIHGEREKNGSSTHARYHRQAPLIAIVRERSFSTGGETKLVSGRSTSFYFDMKPSMLHPEGAQLMAQLILDALEGAKVDLVGGMEIGAVPLAAAVAALSQVRGRPLQAFFVRKQPKEHGARKLVEGLAPGESLQGKRIAPKAPSSTASSPSSTASKAPPPPSSRPPSPSPPSSPRPIFASIPAPTDHPGVSSSGLSRGPTVPRTPEPAAMTIA
jgi:orotate phosphoribosyltransferase